MSKDTTSKTVKAPSKTPAGGRTAKSSKTSAGSALSQRPHSKPANITSAQAMRAVKRYLAEKGA